VKVRNTSDHAGSTVVQVYGGEPSTLVGFEKVALDAGEARTVAIHLEVKCDGPVRVATSAEA
jgi:predicted nucleic acid-binding protein